MDASNTSPKSVINVIPHQGLIFSFREFIKNPATAKIRNTISTMLTGEPQKSPKFVVKKSCMDDDMKNQS